jgi:hypothetical protein
MTRRKAITGLLSAVFLATEFLAIYSLVTAQLEMAANLSVASVALVAVTTRYASAKR